MLLKKKSTKKNPNLLFQDPNDDKNIILEIRGAVEETKPNCLLATLTNVPKIRGKLRFGALVMRGFLQWRYEQRSSGHGFGQSVYSETRMNLVPTGYNAFL